MDTPNPNARVQNKALFPPAGGEVTNGEGGKVSEDTQEALLKFINQRGKGGTPGILSHCT